MPPASPPPPGPATTTHTTASPGPGPTAARKPAPAARPAPGTAVHVRTFPSHPRQAPRARTWLTSILDSTQAADTVIADDAVACLAELVANSVTHSDSRHPGGTITITAITTARLIRVEVQDQGGPWASHHPQPDETGRGLQIVSHLSHRSGITGTGRQSRTVWFEIDTPAPTSPAPEPEPGTTRRPDPARQPDPPPGQAAAAARDLLIQTAELPRSRRQLETIITQYRALLRALAITPGKL